MTRTGRQIVRSALRRIGILDPIEAAHAEQEADAILVASELIDAWRTERLFVHGRARTTYSLTANTQGYTIGSGATFSQDYPSAIDRWGVIPDDDAADPVEIPRGRPLNSDEWARIRVKSTTGAYPTEMYWDRRYSGTLYFYPIPDNNDVDVVLYQAVPQITSLVATTSYDLPPGWARALITNLAVELADHYGKSVTSRLEKAAAESKGHVKRQNYIPRQSPIRGEFVIGRTRRTLNIYTDA